MIAPILVATDFSTRSDRALRRATMIAGQLGAALSLVHVVDSDQPQYLIDAQRTAARSLLEETARTLCRIDDVPAQTNVVVGDVFSGILEVAKDAGAGFIVLGPHRRQLRDAFIGTTAERTIAHSRCPVLMAAGVPSAPYDRALIALGLDEVSKSTLRRAGALGILDGAEIVAMHAFDAPAEGMMKRAMSEPDAIDHYLATERRRASEAFDAFLEEVGLDDVHRALLPVRGTAARTILESARDEEAALIVVGTSQRTGIQRFMLGSVAEDVLADADRDVLVIPAA